MEIREDRHIRDVDVILVRRTAHHVNSRVKDITKIVDFRI